jgi:hypothetical protein
VSILDNYPVTRELEQSYFSKASDWLTVPKRLLQALYDSHTVALQAIHDAPHGPGCNSILAESLCTCWKARALAAAARELGGEVSGG